MKKSFIAKIAVLATAILTIAVWTYAHAYKLPEPPQFPNIPEAELMEQGQTVTVAEYELKRAAVYDAALDLCIEASKGAYVWDEWVSEENKRIILTYRVPSLEVLLSAIEQMDSDGCLCDSFDEPLCRFDKAFYEYNKIAKIK
jgi:hypothetical protein